MFVDFCLGKEWGTIFVFRKNSHNFHNYRVSCPFGSTRVLKCFRFLGAESDRNQSSQPLQKGMGLVPFQWCICIYIAYFLANWKSMKKISHRFCSLTPKNNSWKKHLTAGQWIVNRSERLTWRCGKTHASRQQRFCRPSHASDGFSQKPASQKPFGCKNMSKKVTTHP